MHLAKQVEEYLLPTKIAAIRDEEVTEESG